MKPMKQMKTIQKGNKGFGLKQIAEMTLGSGKMNLAVELPSGEELSEWLAVNTIEFYNEISILYGTLMEYCTQEICATMSAGPKYEYLWADGTNIKTPLKVSASEYIDYLMTWVENQINNEQLFPCQIGQNFPKNFLSVVKSLCTYISLSLLTYFNFRVIIYNRLEYHLNTCFKHFIYFIDEFKLVEEKELAPLAELIQQFKARKNED